jgi:hypothetical protein
MGIGASPQPLGSRRSNQRRCRATRFPVPGAVHPDNSAGLSPIGSLGGILEVWMRGMPSSTRSMRKS